YDARMRRAIRVLGVILVVLALAVVALWVGLRHAPTPTTPGPEAEALAHDMVRSVDGDAWNRTGAVRWKVQWRKHLWDRQRGLARVEWRGNRVLLDVNSKKGRAWHDEVELADGPEKQ